MNWLPHLTDYFQRKDDYSMNGVIAYLRQSAARGVETSETSLSLNAQEAQVRKWAADAELPVKQVFRDHDLRGNDPNRPELRKAIAALDRGDTLVVYDLSRLARDNVLQETIYREVVAQGATLASVTEPHAGDDLYRGLMGVINQQFRQQLGKRISSNIEQKVRSGRFHAKPPFGYSKVDGKLVPNEYAPVVKEVFEMAASGRAFHAIAREMYERYGTSVFRWDHRNVNNMIKRWTYSGGVTWHDEVIWCDGGPCHPPIVSRELQQQAIDITEGRTYQRVKRKSFESPLEGKVYHECGAAAYLRNHGRHHELRIYAAFACRTSSTIPPCGVARKIISDRKLEAMAVEALQRDLSTLPEVMDDALTITEENYEKQLPDTNRRRKELMTRKSDLIRRNERVVDLYTSGVRDRAWMLEQVQTIDADVAEIDHELKHLPAPVDTKLIQEFARVMGAHRHQLTFLGFPDPCVIPLTNANPHLRKRDKDQPSFQVPVKKKTWEERKKAGESRETGDKAGMAGVGP
jgi:DNA invertase Pin-like site-specific DNA recombinase